MTGNVSAEPGSALPQLNLLASASPPPWEALTFTLAALCQVVATLVLFVFAVGSNLSVLITVCWGCGYPLAAHSRLLIVSLASADLCSGMLAVSYVSCCVESSSSLACTQQLPFFICPIVLMLESVNGQILLAAWILSLLLASPQVHSQRAAILASVTSVREAGALQTQWQRTNYNQIGHSLTYTIKIPKNNLTFEENHLKGSFSTGWDLEAVQENIIPKAWMKNIKITLLIVSSFRNMHHIFFVFINLNTYCDPVIYGFCLSVLVSVFNSAFYLQPFWFWALDRPSVQFSFQWNAYKREKHL
uniref:G-protein coupled receptors family 1 profile domain-containing protein n=1 Tax=Mola mola TaxID=94237 RepID=A0A3Q4BAZ8_MOLML